MYDDDVDSVHCLLFEEIDTDGVAGYKGSSRRSQCSYVGVMACVLRILAVDILRFWCASYPIE